MSDQGYSFGFYTAAWCVADNWGHTPDKNKMASEEKLRAAVPFEFLGESSLQYNSQAKITLLILEGYRYLSASYLTELEKANFIVINYEEKFKEIISHFPNIDKHYNIFERNCFLRWLAFKDMWEKDKLSHFIHLDSDLVLYTSLEEIATETKNKTFMLEGCPAFVSVSDNTWFDRYETELKKFDENITDYSHQAMREKTALEKNDIDTCNTSMWRNPLGSDQDLLEYLVGSGKIPQTYSKEIFSSTLFFIENPLLLKYWASPQGVLENDKVTEKDNSIYYGSKKIAFTHYQGTFSMYANIVAIAHYFFPWKLTRLEKYIFYKIEGSKFRIPKLAQHLWKIAKVLNLRMDRKKLMAYMESYEKNQKERRVVTILNHIALSRKNIFTK